MRFLFLTVVAAATIGLAASPAGAASLRVPHKPWSKMTTHQKIVVLRKQIHKDHSVIRFWKNHRYLAVNNNTTAIKMRKDTHWARVSLSIASKSLRRLTYHPSHSYAASGGAGHYQGWMCIHSREGAWNANTGNGYYGGLQMTSGWGGVARPDLLSPAAQMALAERQYRASGYSHAWLAGQWPNTYPPCAGYF